MDKKNVDFDHIRPYHDDEIKPIIQKLRKEKSFQDILEFVFPDKDLEGINTILDQINTLDDFQRKISYEGVNSVLKNSSDGMTISGLEHINPDESYLFISNHRDIVLDTSLLNYGLVKNGFSTTESAIGNNLVQKEFLKTFSRLNRNFLVLRDQSAKELLESSKLLSTYIQHVLNDKKRSIWIAQREGRTKDGNDQTHTGVLKMLTLACENNEELIAFFKNTKIVPVAISYEFDPTDTNKIPELLALEKNEKYVKDKEEDFQTIMTGLLGDKGRIHIQIGEVLHNKLNDLKSEESINLKIRKLADIIDESIYKNYKLWPSNFIAYDWLYDTQKFSEFYNKEKEQFFKQRIQKRLEQIKEPSALQKLLAMYATPVINHPPKNTTHKNE